MGENLRNYKILYISHDGLLDPLGKSQIIPYLKGLSEKGAKFVVLSFERKSSMRNRNDIKKLKSQLAYFGITWKWLYYHKSPRLVATSFDIFCGWLYSLWLMKRYRIKIVHVRSYVAAFIAFGLKKICRLKFIFDMRGFWPEERIEAGIWKKGGLLYRISKYFEKIFLHSADSIVSLTQVARNEIKEFSFLKNKILDITCIPTCVDLEIFRFNHKVKDLEMKRSLEGKFVFIYSGSLSTWYMPQQLLAFFAVATTSIPQAHLLVLTKEEELFMKILKNSNLCEDRISVLSVNYELLPNYLSLGKAGLAFYKPGYSRKGCCPTKLGEYLACGLPVIINTGIGDAEQILKKERTGIIIKEFSEAEHKRANQELKELLLDNQLSTRCRNVAEKYFGLDEGIRRYYAIYQRLLDQ